MPLAQIFHDRSLRLAAGLAVAIAIPVTVLFYFQFRSLNAIEETSSVVLRQLSADSSDSLTTNIGHELRAPYIQVLLRIFQFRAEPLDLPFIDEVFAEGLERMAFVDEFYAWTSVGDVRPNELLAYDRGARERPASERFRRDLALERRLVPRLAELASHRRAIVTMQETIEGRPHYVQAQIRFANAATRDRLSSFIAFSVDSERLRTEYFPSLLRAQLADIQQPTGFPPLVARLLDDSGRVIVDSGSEPTTRYIDEREFPLVFFDKELLQYAAPLETHREIWRLQVGYGNQSVDAIVAASTRPQKALLATLALTLGFGVFFVARAAAREVRVAELKSNFVSSVSHDLKTPLALIQLFAETLELGRLKSTERAAEYYRIINGEARKLTRLIDNILDFSKMEAGLRPYRVGRQSLAEITRGVLAALQSQFAQSQFDVRLEQDDAMPEVLVDADAVTQAIENLLTNAMKYSGASREIVVRVGRQDRYACVSVTDRGIGIARRHQRRIFRKFYRIETDAKTGPQGCGLGLAIVEHTMRGHGGHVRLESEPGRGSTFTLCFPVPPGATVHEAHSGDRGRAADAARTA
jgi:signal transduction histidine kinase